MQLLKSPVAKLQLNIGNQSPGKFSCFDPENGSFRLAASGQELVSRSLPAAVDRRQAGTSLSQFALQTAADVPFAP